MSLKNKVVWSEGMFLNPQHFQQQERYYERLLEGRCSILSGYGWGMVDFELDNQLLKQGKISVLKGEGVFPDGTPFCFPDVDEPPPVFELASNLHDTTVFLCLPVQRPGTVEVATDSRSEGLARFYSHTQEVRDVSDDSADKISLDVGQLQLRLLLGTDDLSGYTCIGILQIAESREDKNILLDENHITACLDCARSPALSGFINELVGLLHHRGESIAGRLADTNRGGTAEIADYMMLQLINRLEPLARHLATVKGLHPVELYQEVLQMVGELSTFTTKSKRPSQFPDYLHDNLQATFTPVISTLRSCLGMVYEQTAIAMQLVEKKYGIRVAEINDRSLIGTAMFVLSARADMPEEALRAHLPAQIKIGPVERIRQLVNAALPGIALKPLPVAPRQIPFHSGYCYFQLDPANEFWKELKLSGGFALHVGGDFPGLEVEFWAIRQ